MKKIKTLTTILCLLMSSANLYADGPANPPKDSSAPIKTDITTNSSLLFNYSLQPSHSLNQGYGLDLGLSKIDYFRTPKNLNNDFSSNFFGSDFAGGCSSKNSLGILGSSISSLYSNTDDIIGKSQCISIRKGEITRRFTSEYCSAFSQCIKTYSGNQSLSPYGMTSVIAKEYAEYQLKNKVLKMADLDKISLFTQKTYGDKFKSTCEPRFNYVPQKNKESACAHNDVLNETFYNFQKHCAATNANCFNQTDSTITSYPAFHDAEVQKKIANQSIVNDFFVEKVKKEVQQSLVDEDKALEEMASFLAGTSSQESKIKNFIASLTRLSKDKKIDPVFDFERFQIISGNFSGTELSKKINDYFKKDKFKGTPEQVKNALKEMRLEMAVNYTQSSCSDTQSLSQICQLTGAIKDSKSVDNVSPFSAAADFPKNDPNYFENQKLFIDHDNPMAREEYYNTLETLRCKAFGFMPPEKKNEYFSSILTGGTGGFKYNPTDYMFSESTSARAIPIKSNYSFKDIELDSSFKEYNDKVKYQSPEFQPIATIPPSNSPTIGVSKGETEVIATKPDLIDSIVSNFNSTPSSSARTPTTNQETTNQNTFANREFSPTNSAANTDASGPQATDKLNTLTRKLADFESKVAQIDSDRSRAIEDEKMRKAEADTAEIESLKAQIAQLKQANNSTGPSNKSIGSNSPNSVDSDEGTNSRGNPQNSATIQHQDERDRTDQDMTDNNGSSKHLPEGPNFIPSSSGVNSSSYSPEGATAFNGRQPASLGSGGGFAPGGVKSALTLTRIDGMSTEKAEETIAEMIKANNGAPFTIEEGGFIKQIIPLVVDGQIQYDSVTGKPKFEKIIKSKIEKNKAVTAEKSPAPPVLDAASLRQVDQVNLTRQNDRARREKLEELTKKFRSN